MTESKKQAELDKFFNFLMWVTEELNFPGCHDIMYEEVLFMSGISDVKHFGPYADHWYGCLESYSHEYLKAKEVPKNSLKRVENIADNIFDSWCEPNSNQLQRFIDEMKAIPIVELFSKFYAGP